MLARIMLPFLTLVALAAAFMGMLNSLHHFFIPALSPAMFNVADASSCAFALVPLMPALGLAADRGDRRSARSLGGVAQLAMQWPPLRREGFRYRPDARLARHGLRRVLHADGTGHDRPGGDAGQRVRQHGARHRPGTGAVSWLNYAFRLMYLPIGLFGVSIATAVLPAVSRHVRRQRRLRRCATPSPTACR